jgi:hypothetical protein
MVISCDAKMIRPDTQIDYVRGNVNDAPDQNTGWAVGLVDEINLGKIHLAVRRRLILKKILAFLTTG